jgi:hypothetical protein
LLLFIASLFNPCRFFIKRPSSIFIRFTRNCFFNTNGLRFAFVVIVLAFSVAFLLTLTAAALVFASVVEVFALVAALSAFLPQLLFGPLLFYHQ